MSACEKCWADAGGNANEYANLMLTRKEHPCTPEQQAGQGATECPECRRLTLHDITGEPMCGCAIDPTPWCAGCGARRQADCHCGPICDNN
jgi:hypothetical protein